MILISCGLQKKRRAKISSGDIVNSTWGPGGDIAAKRA